MANATHVLLKRPDGAVKAFNPDETDVPFLLKSGYQRAPGVQVAAHMRVWPTGSPKPSVSGDSIAPTEATTPASPDGTQAGLTPPPPPSGPPAVGEWDWSRFAGNNAPPSGPDAQVTQGEPWALRNAPGMAAMAGVVNPAAGILGAAGTEAVRQLVDRGLGYPAPATPGEALGKIATEGTRQLLYTGSGIGLAKSVGALANPLMQVALRAGAPEAQALLEHGIQATKGGLQKLNVLLGENGALGSIKRSFLNRMTALGVAHDPAIIAQNAMKDIADRDPGVAKILSNGALSPGAVITDMDRARAAKYRDLFDSWYSDNPGPIKPLDLETARRRYDVAARAHYNMMSGNPSKAEADALDPKGIFNKAMADAMREQQDLGSRGLTAIHPQTGTPTTLADVNGTIGRLARAQDVLAPLVTGSQASLGAKILQRGAAPAAGATMGALLPGNRGRHAVEGALLGAGANSPTVMSALAHLMSNPALASVLATTPRVVGNTAGAVFGH